MAANNADFKICTFNCNGLNDSQKRKDVFDFLRNLNCSIYFLQETHLKTQSENFIRSCWGYNIWLSGSDTNKNGVAILFNNNFEYKVHKVIRDPEGAYIVLDIELLKKRLTLVNVYGPSSGDNPNFIERLKDYIAEIGNDYTICAGDWNCVLDMKIDTRNYQSTINRPRTRYKIKEFMSNYNLVDAWREFYPNSRAYTWRKFNSVKQSRLDYFILSEELVPEISKIKIEPGYRSDHSFVILSLKKEQIKRDRPFWKFNNSLLKDKDYVDQIKELILELKEEYAVKVYALDNIKNIPNEDIQFQISDQLFFEMLLTKIRGKTISYASYKKKSEKMKEENLMNEIGKLETNVEENTMIQLEELKTQLQEIRDKRIEGMLVRSRVRWMQDGEKGSKYFCNLEKRNFVDKSLGFIEKENGEVISDQKDILNEVKQFYANLYSFKDVNEIDLKTTLPNAPTLSDENSKLIEGQITFAEAALALKNMKNNKSPGPDGFTVEFYKFFFTDIGIFLVRSINNGFQEEQLSVTQRQGMITCIPKEDKPKQYLNNWRPISLLNTAYKIASACIANRLKTVLPDIIHECQTGFLKGRYIGENIRLLYDTLMYTETEQIPGLLLQIDFSKAFDSVSWKFIQSSLEFFNFGPDIKRWVRTFYNKANSCISVNGQYSTWFNIERGVRQGDPCSPYLYLICAEILSLMIRTNDKIKGIKLKEKEFLLSQFADDTTLGLDGSKRSFTEAIHTFDLFSSISGLHINNDKTIAVWIGSRKNCGVRFCRDRNFCWDPGIFKILGVKFSTDTNVISDLNYEGKILKIRRILNIWKKRQLTPLGKITVIKTLVIPTVAYLFINVPDPSDIFLRELEGELFGFLWDNKPSKIKKAVVFRTYEDGGLKMCNIYSFLAAMKLGWLKRLEGGGRLKDFTHDIYPILDKVISFGGEYANLVMQRTQNAFWKDVMKHYKKIYVKTTVTSIDEFMSECIHYNINITRDKKVIYVKEWCDEGVIKIGQLVNADGNFMTFDEFRLEYPNVERTNFLIFEGIIKGIKQYLRKCDLQLSPAFKIGDPKLWTCLRRGNKFIQQMWIRCDIAPVAVDKWNKQFINLNWKLIFTRCFQISVDTRLKWFQARILHRLIPTEKFLHACKIADSPLCVFCKGEIETIVHLFWHCDLIKTFWKDLLTLLKSKCLGCEALVFTEQLVLFGVSENIVTDKVLDLIVLHAKFYIFKCKLQKALPVLQVYLKILGKVYTDEKFLATISGKYYDFCIQWMPYMSILN